MAVKASKNELAMIDTHAHIYAPEFDADRKEMLEKAFKVGISHIFMPNIDHTSIDAMLELEAAYPGKCLAMMGLHPCYVNASFEKELQIVEAWLDKRNFIAVGEIGLDFYWSTEFRKQQEEAFKFQVQLAKKHGLPIVVHCRNSFSETVELLQEVGTEGLKGIFHCFTGSLEDAQKVIEMGFLLGIGGVSTFKNGGLDKILPYVDLSHIVLETDSPYLAPVPYRGKRNETSYLPLIAQRAADLKKMPVEQLAIITTENASQLINR
jgi:TatD DNase family protein